MDEQNGAVGAGGKNSQELRTEVLTDLQWLHIVHIETVSGEKRAWTESKTINI